MSETVALPTGLPDHVRPGLVIGGKYRLEQEIGRGSMGTVYRAQHVTLGQRVAIKLISTEHSESLEARKRFSVEAKAAAKLRSRHVVQVIDDGETAEGNPYIVLEYLEGETLEQRLERDHDVPLNEAQRIVVHVCRALARAHAQGIVHRDLKPANIFLVKSDDDDAGWVAKVLDFGIAKLDHAGDQGDRGTTQAGTVLGTPLFMSPEQVRGASSVDHRADLYSLGMCLYHMLTGEFAYYAPHYSDILIGICTQPLPLLREKAPWIPSSVELWFQRACAREPLERFQSADEMAEALTAAAGGSPLSKHKSVPEGRIAPETLVGYATPAAAALPTMLDAGARGRTLVISATPTAQSRPDEPDERGLSGSAWLPRRAPSPLLLGVVAGLLTLVALGATLSFLDRAPADREHAKLPAEVPSVSVTSTPYEPPASPAKVTVTSPPSPPEPPAATAAPTEASAIASKGTQRTRPSSPKKPAKNSAPVPKPAAPQRAPGSDLGF